jgi:hypothetical protein
MRTNQSMNEGWGSVASAESCSHLTSPCASAWQVEKDSSSVIVMLASTTLKSMFPAATTVESNHSNQQICQRPGTQTASQPASQPANQEQVCKTKDPSPHRYGRPLCTCSKARPSYKITHVCFLCRRPRREISLAQRAFLFQTSARRPIQRGPQEQSERQV